MTMGKLFGTDGIRGKANHHPMTADVALRVGRALGFYLRRSQGCRDGAVVLGRDTRLSGQMIESALIAGVSSSGFDVLLAGIIPTPAVAMLTAELGAAAGIVVSASHNPFEDNGIKVFDAAGFKLSQAQEQDLEAMILDDRLAGDCREVTDTGQVAAIGDAAERYQGFLSRALPAAFHADGLKVVVDCSNGATAAIAGPLFKRLGIQASILFDRPDGRNINRACGSEHPEALRRAVLAEKARAGLAFDGDGDRLIAVDESGRILTGDQALALSATHLLSQGRLPNRKVVATVMSNLGLRESLARCGMELVTCDVGDRFVAEAMRAQDARLGGEDSGHMIFADHHTTGDGLLSALKLLEAMSVSGEPLSQLAEVMTVYPQHLVNVPVRAKPTLESLEEVRAVISQVEARLGSRGRVLVRYSGTQPMCRVMVEGPTREETEAACETIAAAVRRAIGA
jgi:phosphoglucosamine mutase